MRNSGKSLRTGLVLIAISAFLMQGCAALAVATVAAGGGVGYALSQNQHETTASAAPDADDEPSTWNEPTGATGPSDTGQPTNLVEPQAPVESVEVEPIQ